MRRLLISQDGSVARTWQPDDFDVEALAARAVGTTLTGVRYWDLPLFAEPLDEWPDTGPHVVAHGVDLILGETILAVTWGRDELELFPLSLVDYLLTGRFETVPEKAPWLSLIGHQVNGARIHCLDATASEFQRRFPFALELQFGDAGFVVLAAASCPSPNQPAFPGGDDIVVAWLPDHIRTVLPDLTDPLGLA